MKQNPKECRPTIFLSLTGIIYEGWDNPRRKIARLVWESALDSGSNWVEVIAHSNLNALTEIDREPFVGSFTNSPHNFDAHSGEMALTAMGIERACEVGADWYFKCALDCVHTEWNWARVAICAAIEAGKQAYICGSSVNPTTDFSTTCTKVFAGTTEFMDKTWPKKLLAGFIEHSWRDSIYKLGGVFAAPLQRFAHDPVYRPFVYCDRTYESTPYDARFHFVHAHTMDHLPRVLRLAAEASDRFSQAPPRDNKSFHIQGAQNLSHHIRCPVSSTPRWAAAMPGKRGVDWEKSG